MSRCLPCFPAVLAAADRQTKGKPHPFQPPACHTTPIPRTPRPTVSPPPPPLPLPCPAGESCGLVKNLALMTHVTTDEEEAPIARLALIMGVEPASLVNQAELREQ